MDPAEPRAPADYDLAIGDGSMRFKLAEARLTLSDEGIRYALDGREGLRPFSQLRSVRIQAVQGGKSSPWEAMIELVFDRGNPLQVHSGTPWGADDPHRDPVFIAFVEDLHRRIPLEDAARIRFLRGVPEGRHRILQIALVIFLIVFGGAGGFILLKTAGGTIPVAEMLFPMLGLIGFGVWIWHSVEKSKPGTYRPDRLPRDLFPERD
ncbi:hypothetical protein [Bosea sp. (in: a-proteobacteria)]|uniref:hypothetical protein n=1 Tax=Bosea sp. (in: a-proteobacteria) TaxID=1871050 RepID=UPI003F6FAF34